MVNPVQTNNLPSFLLGSYNHPQFGRSNSSFVGQMVPSEYNHDFGDNVVLDSVVLTIPYFSRGVDTSEEGDITYEIDSVYGDEPIKISVYRNITQCSCFQVWRHHASQFLTNLKEP